MSGDDFLSRATRALRETGEVRPAEVAMTRARVLDTLRRGERRGRRLVWLLLPIAAVLAGSTALAKSSGGLGRVWHEIAASIGIADWEPLPDNTARVAQPREQPSPLSDEPPHVDPDERSAAERSQVTSTEPLGTAPSAPLSVDLRARRPEAKVATPPRALPAAPSSLPAPPPEARDENAARDAEAAALALYKKAHQLHFVEQRYAEALLAWDEYLRAVPDGRLGLEARYNRGIALVRLGRKREAEAALAPFARGEMGGGYRKQEAAALLEALTIERGAP